MKASKYNYIINKKNYSYWYNGIKHTYFILPLELGIKIDMLLKSDDTIKYIPKSFNKKLVDAGFLVPNDKDELAVIRKKNIERINSKNYLLVILPTLNCNFKCWYCIQDHIPSKMSTETIEIIERHIDYMINVEKIESLQIEWFGGEPFMYFKQVIQPICTYAQNKCKDKNIVYFTTATTNGYFLMPKIVNELKKIRFRRFQVTLDGPKIEHDKVKYQKNCISAFDHVLSNIEYILNNTSDIQFLLRINYTEHTLNYQIVEDVNKIISISNRNRIKISPKKVWQENVRKDRYNSVNILLDLFEKSGYNTVRFDIINDFVPCYANRKFYNAINYNGDVVKCTACDDLYEKKSHGTINENGSIIWDRKFIKRFEEKSFENKKCLVCKFLPICMGICPRDYGTVSYCKFDGMDLNIEEALVNYIDAAYKINR